MFMSHASPHCIVSPRKDPYAYVLSKTLNACAVTFVMTVRNTWNSLPKPSNGHLL